jgi:hypothetical protein
MAVDLTKFTKGRSFKPADFNFNDATDLIEIKTDATSAVGIAIAAGGSTVAGASAAETIAGTVTDKYIAPDDLKAALQSNADYKIDVDRTRTSGVVITVDGTVIDGTRTLIGRLGASDGNTQAGVQGLLLDNGAVVATAHLAARVNATETAGVFVPTHPQTWAGYFEGPVKTTNNIYTGAAKPSTVIGFNDNGSGMQTLTGGRIFASGEAFHLLNLTSTALGSTLLEFRLGAVAKGSVTISSTSVAYNTTSDYRLKNVDGPLTGSGAFIDALKPKVGEWKAELGKKAAFFIAHEVAEVSPTSVQGEKDEVDADGKPKMQSVAYGSAEFIVNIVAELQDLRKRVAALEAK